MKYDFDTLADRRNTNSLKWNVAEGELPMWVADMDFAVAAEIQEAIRERAAHGIFGYSIVPDEWYEAYIGWWGSRHGFVMEKEWLSFCSGVIPALSSIIRKLTTPAEKILLQTPVYNHMFNSILNNGRQVLESRLDYRDGVYRIDFADLEEKLADPQTTMMILCNPHNPIGQIWDRETLARIGELCCRHHVLVVSDEIHCDLTDPGCDYVPYASASEVCRDNSITCIAPSKTFNIAGLQTAAVVVPDPVLRHKVRCGLTTDEVGEPNVFAINAAVAALTKGADWLDQLRSYVQSNKKWAVEFIAQEMPEIKVDYPRATYLLWLDVSGVCGMAGKAAEAAGFIREQTGLFVSYGGQFGGNGDDFFRVNIACPRSVLEDGLKRLKAGVEAYKEMAGKQA